MRVLVTGACGFVGPYLIRELKKAGHTVYGTVFSADSVDKDNELHQLDVRDLAQCQSIVQEVQPEAVFHLAGIAFAPDAAKNFSNALTINVGGTFNVCEALSGLSERVPFIYVSSGEVYGAISESALPITEFQAPAPNNPYSITKLQGEEVVRFFTRRKKISGVIARPFNHIGPGQGKSFVCSSFASQLAEIASEKREAVIRVGNLEALRDFMDVRDVVRGYVALLGAVPGIYNLSSGTSVKIDDILHILIEISGVDVKIEQDPERMRPSEVKEVRGSFDKMYKLFNWKPEIDIESSLREIYQYWVDR